jgi:hypothetical protein
VLEAPRSPARVLAVFPAGVYLEVRTELEPSVLAVITGAATRLPNSVLLAADLPRVTVGDEAAVGDGSVELGRLSVRARRWWDPAPPLGRVDPVRLRQAAPRLTPGEPGLAGNDAIELLAAGCASGRLLSAVTAAERLVGLGPGLTPSGDKDRAVWLADWLAATVTYDARTRTTPISATLLHCAARGEASPEVIAVLRGIAGRQELEPARRQLRRLGHTSGSDLLQGISIGLDTVLAMTEAPSPVLVPEAPSPVPAPEAPSLTCAMSVTA